MRNLTRPMILGAALALLGGAASAQPAGPAAPYPGPGMAAATGAATGLAPDFAPDCPDSPGVFAAQRMDPGSHRAPEPASDPDADVHR